jgi:phosphoribosylformylglycinamidine cyclo-ligase
MKKKLSQYEKFGASASKSGLHTALKNAGASSTHSGFFAQLGTDYTGDPKYKSFLHCDGAGTKSIVAYLLYKSTGDPNVFSGLAQDALVMNLDDVFCVGIPENLLLANTIQRNANLIDDLILEAIIKQYNALCSLFSGFGINIEMVGGETADCGDIVRTILVDAVLAGRVKNDNLINANAIVPGDIIIGLSSTGQATYENSPNSGIGSNGLTLARHALLKNEYAVTYPEVLDPAISLDTAYNGPFSVTDTHNKLNTSIGSALLSPTRSYAPLLMKIYEKLSKNIHGAIHVTGGGQTKILRFGQNNLYIKDNLFDTPPIFELIKEHGEVDWREMYQVFNMGHRFELYVPEQFAKNHNYNSK